MDINSSVIMPREDFLELSEAAWNQPTPTGAQRVATTVQTTLFCASAALAVAGATWGWSKAVNWLEERRLQRDLVRMDNEHGYAQK